MDDQFGLRTKSQLSKSQLSNFQFPTSQLFCPHRRSKMKTAIRACVIAISAALLVY